ncbi:O-antigen ligase family protein [Vibrio sonorensis]|uniref:O-antigen ligase family protein n=1 Tax=Vibrio sonorensis TaxID=1004316 RepID=UPI0008D92753|nr:O-antigen ligase family protein [Vibrio sonorensis]
MISRSSQAMWASLLILVPSLLWLLIPRPEVILVLAVLPLGALFVIHGTFWFVCLFVLFSFFRLHEAFPLIYNFKIPLLLSLGALSGLLWHTLISMTLKPYWHKCLTLLCIFWMLVILGIVTSSNPGLAIEYFKNIYWKIKVMTLAITWLINDEFKLNKMAVLIVVCGLLVSSVALFNSANGIGLVEGSRVTIGRNLGSMLGDPNDLSLVLMFPLAFALGFAMTKEMPTSYRILGLVVSVLTIFAVLATQSRGGLLGSLAVFGIFALKRIKSKTLLVLLCGIVAMVLFVAAGISGRKSGGAAEAGIDESAMGRLYAWEAAFKMALDNPITGVGLQNFYANYFFYSSHWDGLNHAVHSTWFGILAETGFLGLGIFIALIVVLIKCAKRNQNQIGKFSSPHPILISSSEAIYAGLVGTIVSGTFLTQGFTWPIYILASLNICVSHIVQKNLQKQNQNENS